MKTRLYKKCRMVKEGNNYKRLIDGNFYFFISGDALYIAQAETGVAFLVKVIPSSEYVIKVNKKSVSAIDGEHGLFHFLDRCITDNFATCYVDKIIEMHFPETA